MSIEEIREKIDCVDEGILRLFLERMSLSENVAQYKIENNLPLLNREREREILARVSNAAGKDDLYAYRLFSELFNLSKARQAELINSDTRVAAQIKEALTDDLFPQSGTVACQGVEGANSQIACEKIMPRANIVYMKTFEAVFDAVESGLCSYGVLPIENSSAGSVRAVYDLLLKKDFSIVRSTKLCIRHELLCVKGASLSDIKEIYTHEQAISQCSKFLASLEGVKVIPCANTALAAKNVAQKGDIHAAAISSHECSALYNLDVCKSDICDSDNNYTRFIAIAKKSAIYGEANRISLVAALPNKSGALYELLAKAASIGVNMSKLESCPVTGRNFEFIFFIDLDASVRDEKVRAMLEQMEQSCESFNLLGNYAEV